MRHFALLGASTSIIWLAESADSALPLFLKRRPHIALLKLVYNTSNRNNKSPGDSNDPTADDASHLLRRPRSLLATTSPATICSIPRKRRQSFIAQGAQDPAALTPIPMLAATT